MKNKNVIKYGATILLPIVMGIGVVFGVSQPSKTEEVSGYSISELPTTIDLNDTSAANIRSYYSSLNSLTQNERKGNNLLKNLKTILKNGQKYYSYDVSSGLPIWQMYEITDRDWSKSPASAITYGSYNASTKTITNYVYGSNSDYKNDPYVHALYCNRNVTNEAKAWGDHTQSNWGINREHVWAKAEGFEASGEGGARGDPMHLMAANGYANNIHSNYFFGYVDTTSSYTDCGSSYSYTSGNYRGKSKTLGGTTNVFEPQDSDKGDIARAIFYMVARYNYLSGSDSDGISSDNPNLSLTQSLSDWSSSSFTSSTSTKGYMGVMTDLLAWHRADPVDEYEIHRNNLLYTNYTNNRNPFIDFPEWADFIWGTATYNGTTYQSYSSTPTGYAAPSTDTINGYNSGQSSGQVTGVSLNSNSETLDIGGSVTLTATVSPSNASNKNVTWSSSNTGVATVNNGVITAVSNGSATITVRSAEDSSISDTCSISVNDHVTLNYTNSPFSSTSYSSTAETVNVFGINYENKYGMKYTTDTSIEFAKNTNAYLGNTTAYGKSIDRVVINWKKYENSSLLNVFEGTSALPTSTSVTGSTSGLVTTYNFANNNSKFFNIKVVGTNYYTNFSSIEIYFKDGSSQSRTLSSISVSGQQTSFNVDDSFTFGGVVTATFSDGSSANVTSSATFSGYDMSNAGTQTVTVSYTYEGATKTTTYQITVSSGVTPTPVGGVTLDLSIATYASQNSWQNSTNYLIINGDDVITFTADGTPGAYGLNTGKYYTSGTNWRFYQSEGGTLTVSAVSGFIIKSVKLTYTVGNTGVCTFNSSNVESDETVTVNAMSAVFGVGNTGSATNGNIRISNITVVYAPSYTIVTNVNELGTGDEVIFVGTNNTKYYEATTISNSVLNTAQVASPANSIIELSDDATSFIVEKTNSLFRFKDSTNGYLSTKNNSGDYCQYESVSSPTNKSLFSLTIGNNGNVSSLVGQDTSTRRYVRFDYNSGNNPFFSCYSSSSSTYSFAIYKKTTQVDADFWAFSFLSGTENCNLSTWSSLAESYNELTSFAKNEIIACVANASTDYSKRSQAMARYEYILNDGRFSDATNFIAGRNVASVKPFSNPLFNDNTNIVLVIAVALSSTSVLLFVVLLKRRKQVR